MLSRCGTHFARLARSASSRATSRNAHRVSAPQRPTIFRKWLNSASTYKIHTVRLSSDWYHNVKPIVLKKMLYSTKSTSWNSFRKETEAMQEKLTKLMKESTGYLDRATADVVVDEILALRQAHPGQRDGLLPSDEFEESSVPVVESPLELKLSKDPVIERYEALMILASNCRDPRLVLSLFEEIIQRKLRITPVMLNTALSSCLSDANPMKAKQLLQQYEPSVDSSNVSSGDGITLSCAMRTYIALGDAHSMGKVYRKLGEMVKNKVSMRGDVVRSVLELYVVGLAVIGYRRLSSNLYHQIKQENPSLMRTPNIQLTMLDLHSELQQYEVVEEIFDDLATQNDVQMPIPSVIRVVLALLHLKKREKAKKVYQQIEAKMGPSAIPKNWSWSSLEKLANTKSGGIGPMSGSNKETDNALTTRFGDSEDTTAYDLLREHPSKEKYEHAIIYYAGSGNLVLADSLFDDYLEKYGDENASSKRNGGRNKTNNSVPSAKVIAALFQGGARLGNARYLELVSTLDQSKLPPSLTRAMVRFFIARSNAPRATETFMQILKNFPSTVDGNMVHDIMTLYLTGPSSLAKSGIQFYHTVLEELPNSTLDIEFFNAAMNLFAKEKYGQGLASALEQLKKRSLLPNTGTYNCLMQIYLEKKEYKTVLATYAQMIERAVLPDTNSIIALITTLGESKALAEPKMVQFLKQQLIEYPIIPDTELMEVLKRAAILSRNPAAYGIIMRALASKFHVKLSAANYLAWLTALLECDQIRRALDLATILLKESENAPELLTYGFCMQLALHVSKESGSDLDQQTVERWTIPLHSSTMPLATAKRAQFEKDLTSWLNLFPEDSIL